MDTAVKRPSGETGEKWLPDLNTRQRHRASPRPYTKVDSVIRDVTGTARQTCGHNARSPGRRGAAGRRVSPKIHYLPGRAPRAVLSCHARCSVQLVLFVARLLAAHRRGIGTRCGARALSTRRQAVFTLGLVPGPARYRSARPRFGISQATAYRYLDEAIAVLAARAPDLHEALDQVKEQGLPHLILDGKVVAADRLKEKTISRKGREIDRWYSGKGSRLRREHSGPLHPRRHPAVGLPGPSRRRP
jgi:hypothetical protein